MTMLNANEVARMVDLGEVATLQRGTTITRAQTGNGKIPVIAGGREPAYLHNLSNRDGETIVVAGSGAYAGHVSYWNGPIFVSDAFSIKPHTELHPRYCFHWLLSRQEQIHALKSGGGVPHVYAKDVAKLRIPVPTLEIQYKIVEILDTFIKLKSDLESEFEARRKQYHYYRDELLDFDFDIYHPLDDVILNLRTGLNPRKNFTLNPFGAINKYITVRELGGFNINISDKTDSIDDAGLAAIQNRSKLDIGDVLFSATGTIGKTALVDKYPKDWNIKEGIYAITPDSENLCSRFLIYSLNCSKVKKQIFSYSDGSTVSSIPMSAFRKIKIPIPSLKEQAKIVSMLDNFDDLIGNLSTGLPSEINARQRQYEHYRDQLLTFKEAA